MCLHVVHLLSQAEPQAALSCFAVDSSVWPVPPEHQVHKDLHGDLGTDTIRPGEHLEGTETMKQETVSRDRRGACGQVC